MCIHVHDSVDADKAVDGAGVQQHTEELLALNHVPGTTLKTLLRRDYKRTSRVLIVVCLGVGS